MGSKYQALIVHSNKSRRYYHHPKVSILTRKITPEYLTEIYLNSDVLLVMREDTMPYIVLEIRVTLTRRRETREDIMLTLQRMMNLP